MGGDVDVDVGQLLPLITQKLIAQPSYLFLNVTVFDTCVSFWSRTKPWVICPNPGRWGPQSQIVDSLRPNWTHYVLFSKFMKKRNDCPHFASDYTHLKCQTLFKISGSLDSYVWPPNSPPKAQVTMHAATWAVVIQQFCNFLCKASIARSYVRDILGVQCVKLYNQHVKLNLSSST